MASFADALADALSLLAWGLVAASGLGLAYQVAAAALVRRFAVAPWPVPSERVPVSVLKPLCGDEPGLLANLRSFVDQHYPAQLVFGVRDPEDPALEAVDRLRRERGLDARDHPVVTGAVPDPDPCAPRALPQAAAGAESRVDILVLDAGDRPGVASAAPVRGANLKVANLLRMLPAARHDILVVADSDMRAPDGYLAAVVALLEQPGVGLVTCLYVGRPMGGLWSRLGAMGINHGFLPSALVARGLGRRDGAFGATLALRRQTLEAAGGLESLADVLADDYVLGARVRGLGLEIAVAPCLLDTTVDERGLRALLAHEIRWGRTVAAVAPLSHAASILTQPVALAALAVLAGGSDWPLVLSLAAVFLGRLRAVRVVEGALGLDPASAWMVALRDALSLVVFCASVGGRSVLWRGRRFRVRRGGILEA